MVYIFSSRRFISTCPSDLPATVPFCVFGFGFWVLGFRFVILGFGFWVRGFEVWVLVFWCSVIGLKFQVRFSRFCSALWAVELRGQLSWYSGRSRYLHAPWHSSKAGGMLPKVLILTFVAWALGECCPNFGIDLFGVWVLGFGCWVLGVGFWVLGFMLEVFGLGTPWTTQK